MMSKEFCIDCPMRNIVLHIASVWSGTDISQIPPDLLPLCERNGECPSVEIRSQFSPSELRAMGEARVKKFYDDLMGHFQTEAQAEYQSRSSG